MESPTGNVIETKLMTVTTKIPIFDGHNDTLLKLFPIKREGGRSFFVQSDQGHLDLPRAREGGFGGGMFAICVPSDPATSPSFEEALMITETGYEVQPFPAREHEYAQRFTISAMAGLFQLAADGVRELIVVA